MFITKAGACKIYIRATEFGRLASYAQQLHSISVNHSPNPNPNLNPTPT